MTSLAEWSWAIVWRVGRRIKAGLMALGIATPLALKQADVRFIRERFSVVLERTVTELRGVPCIELEEASPDRKSIMASRSFGKTVENRQEFEEASEFISPRYSTRWDELLCV